MKTSNDIDLPGPVMDAGEVSDEILRAMVLATQALDGHGLSDMELELLCDSLLSNQLRGRGNRMSQLPQSSALLKLTPRQNEVMDNLSHITTDGSRHEPQPWLNEKNVSSQVRSLRNHGIIELKDGCLAEVDQTPKPRRAAVDTKTAVAMMRELLEDGA